MKNWRVFTGQKALEDIQDIYPIIAKDNPAAAEAFLNAVEAAAAILSQTPEIGSPRYFDHPELEGLRYLVLKKFPNYLLFYRLLTAGQVIEVVRIVHGARDLPALFGKEEKPGSNDE